MYGENASKRGRGKRGGKKKEGNVNGLIESTSLACVCICLHDDLGVCLSLFYSFFSSCIRGHANV